MIKMFYDNLSNFVARWWTYLVVFQGGVDLFLAG